MRLLVVEDDVGIGELVSEDLSDHGYAVDWAQDGDEALSLLHSFPYDLLVLDIMLPGSDGYAITEEVRGKQLSVPVLMLTARDAVDDRIKGLDVGADDYLVKPFNLGELRARVRALLRRAQGQASNSVSVGRLAVELANKRVFFDGREVNLTGTEYALLAFLALHPNGYYPRGELMEHVWPSEVSIDPRTVDSYIRYLRRKLAADAIETRRGLGYRLIG